MLVEMLLGFHKAFCFRKPPPSTPILHLFWGSCGANAVCEFELFSLEILYGFSFSESEKLLQKRVQV